MAKPPARYFFLALLAFMATSDSRGYAQSSLCYAKPGGNDLSDGSYWAFAKADIMSCYDALPPSGGVIFVMDSGSRAVPACSPLDPQACGIWIMGPGDPNYKRPPAGWRRRKSGAVSVIGVAGGGAVLSSRPPIVKFTGGSAIDNNHPAIWLSGVQSMKFENLSVTGYPAVAIRISVDSTGNRSGAGGGCQSIEFSNIATQIAQNPGNGPPIDIGSSTYWVWIRDFVFGGNASEATAIASASRGGLVRASSRVKVTTTWNLPRSWVTGTKIGIVGASDSSFNGTGFSIKVVGPNTFFYSQGGLNSTSGGGIASSDLVNPVVMDPGSGTGANVYFSDGMVTSGGIKVYGGYSGQSFTVQNLNMEGGLSPPVWVANCVAPTAVSVNNIQIADSARGLPGLRVDCDKGFAAGVVAQNTSVDGPATLGGGAGPSSLTVQPSLYSQSGIYNGHLIGQADDARRGFGPVVARWPNLANQVIANWGNQGCYGAAPPIPTTAPDGTTNAGRSTSTVCFFTGSAPMKAGDWVVAGAWVRSEQNTAFGANTLTFQCMGCTTNPVHGYMHAALGGSGEWQWVWGVFNILSANSPKLYFYGSASLNQPGDFFAPVLIDIPAGEATANEAAEIGLNLQTYRNDALPGQVSLLRGEQFKADSIQIGNCATVTSGKGVPTSKPCSGSVYLRQDGGEGATFYIYENDSWKAKF